MRIDVDLENLANVLVLVLEEGLVHQHGCVIHEYSDVGYASLAHQANCLAHLELLRHVHHETMHLKASGIEF